MAVRDGVGSMKGEKDVMIEKFSFCSWGFQGLYLVNPRELSF